MLTKRKEKENSPVCPLHVPGHDMNLCNSMLAKAKYIKLNCSASRGSSAVPVRFQGAKKRPGEGKDLNSIVSNAVKEFIR